MLRSLLLVAVLLVALPAVAADEVARNWKSNGTTSFQTGDTILASELNDDLDTLVTKINGNIDTGNLADASVTSAKLSGALDSDDFDDKQGTTAELFEHADGVASATNKIPDRNAGTPNGLATTLSDEIFQLRRMLRRLTVGDSAVTGDGDVPAAGVGGTQAKAGAWFDPPFRGPNLLRNGDFEMKQTIDGDATLTPPDGWTKVGSPTALALATAPVGEGDGSVIGFDGANAAEEGLSQTLAELKGSTRYLLIARVRNDTGTGCGIETSGDDNTTDFPSIDQADDSGSAFGTLSGYFITDAAATSVVVRLVTDGSAATDDCSYDHAGVYEMNADPIPTARRVVAYKSTTETTAAGCQPTTGSWLVIKDDGDDFGGAADDCLTDMEIITTVPTEGCTIEIDGIASFDPLDNDVSILVTILENGSAVGTAAAATGRNNGTGLSVPVHYVNTAPVPGTTMTYELASRAAAASDFLQGGAIDGIDLSSSIKVVVECGG